MFLKILSFDLEVLPIGGRFPDPKECPILLISTHVNYDIIVEDRKIRNIILVLSKDESENGMMEFDEKDRLTMYLSDEAVMIEKLFELMKNNDVLTGYNINGFDLPYIIDRWKVLGGEPVNVGNNEKKLYYKKHTSKGMSVVKVGNLTGKIIFDVMYLLRREDESNIFKKQYNLKNVTLKHVSKEILKIEKLEFSVEEMIDYWEKGWNVEDVREKFIDYCSRDSELALMFVTRFRLLDRFMMMSKRSGKLLQTVMDSLGSGILVENLMLKAYKVEDRVMPCRGTSLRNVEDLGGAEVLNPKLGVSENLASVDYKSLYPSVMITHNICYSTIIEDKNEAMRLLDEGKAVEEADEKGHVYGVFIKKEVYVGIVPKILSGLLGERAALKKELKKQEKGSAAYILYDAQQQAVKILLNSFYGYSGDKGAKLYYWTVATAVTTNGRKVIKKTWHIILDEIGIVDFEGRRFQLALSAGDSVTGDIPVLFFERNNEGNIEADVLTIQELYNHYYGYGEVFSFGQKEIYVDSRSGLTPLKGVYRHKVSKSGYKINTSMGFTKVTEDHSLFRNGEEIKPTELNVGSFIDLKETKECYVNEYIKEHNITEEMAWVYGLFAAEGSCGFYKCDSGDKYTWHIDQLDVDVLIKCAEILNKHDNNYNRSKYSHKGGKGEYIIIDITESSGVYRLYYKGGVKELVQKYERLFYNRDGFKIIPKFILNSNDSIIIAFLDGYYLGDGGYHGKYVEFSTDSLVLYKGLEYLNLRLGNMLHLKVDKRDVIKRDGKDYQCKNRQEAYYGMTKSTNDMLHNCYIDRNTIRDIEKIDIDNKYVYDLTTEDGTFIAGLGNIIHHNTDSSYIEVKPLDKGEISREEVVGCVMYVLEHVNSVVEKPMELAFENYVERMIIVAKKHYAMLVVDDSGRKNIISKGIESVRRDYCDFATENMSAIVDFVLLEKDLTVGVNKSVELIKTQGRKLKRGQIDAVKLIMSNKLTKAITEYDNKESHVLVAIQNKERGRPSEIGDRVQFLVCNNGKKLITEKAEDVEWALKNKIPIDYDYYLNNQLVPPAMKILGLLGVKKEVLVVSMDEKQTTLSKWF